LISRFKVRAATVVTVDKEEHVVLGGNTEYEVPEAIHGESSLLNHVTTLYGPDATRHAVRFVAFFSQRCGVSGSCGDCRDFQHAVTDYAHLLIMRPGFRSHGAGHTLCRSARIKRNFPQPRPIRFITPVNSRSSPNPLPKPPGGVTLFTTARHTGAAGLLPENLSCRRPMMPPSLSLSHWRTSSRRHRARLLPCVRS
jgi:hypothetical protein